MYTHIRFLDISMYSVSNKIRFVRKRQNYNTSVCMVRFSTVVVGTGAHCERNLICNGLRQINYYFSVHSATYVNEMISIKSLSRRSVPIAADKRMLV